MPISKIQKYSVALIAVLSSTMGGAVFAAELDGKALFNDRTCATCHGKDANTPITPGYPAVGGQSAEYTLAQMMDIKSGTRSNGQSEAMRVIMQLVTDEESAAIAQYISTLEYKPGLAISKVAKSGAPATSHASDVTIGEDGKKREWMVAGGERDIAMDLEPDLVNGIEVYEVCAGCHLTEGWGKPDGTFPQLAGQHKAVLIKQLADIRGRNRDNPTMYPFALPEAIGDEQALADVVGYIAKLPMNPENGKGQWEEGTPEFELGKKLYADNCVKCHDENGEGKAAEYYPKIQGQHYNYMLRQFEWIRDGKRRNANPDMVDQIKSFSDMDMKAVINYTSRIPVPKEDLAPSVDWLNPDFD